MSDNLISHQYVENSPASQEKNNNYSSQEKDDYSVNPNQKVYDMPHQVDHEVNVLKIYFAEQKPKMKWENKEESYTVQSVNGATVKTIRDKKDKDLKTQKKEIKNIQVLDSTADTKVLSDSTKLKKGESVKIKYEENVHQKGEDGKPAYDPLQINKAFVKKIVWVVANCEGTRGTLSIQINENKLKNEELVYENPIKFLIGDEEKDKIEFKLDDRMAYHQEITLRPKSDDNLKKLIEKFEKRADKNAFLYMKAEVRDTDDEVKFPDDTHEFLNTDGERLIVSAIGRAPWMELAWIEEAKNLKETGHNKEIQKYFTGTAHEQAMKTGEKNEKNVSWCAAFVNWIMRHYGYVGITTDSGYDAARALKWAKWPEGRDIGKPVYGAIAVKTRDGGGHVGFVAGKKGNKVVILGGNQSQRLYCVAYDASDYFAYIIPNNYEITEEDYNLPEYQGNPGEKGSEQ